MNPVIKTRNASEQPEPLRRDRAGVQRARTAHHPTTHIILRPTFAGWI